MVAAREYPIKNEKNIGELRETLLYSGNSL